MKVQIWMFVYLTWIIAENVLALDVSTSSTPFSVNMVSINSSPSINNVVGISYSLSQNYSTFNTPTVSVIQNISNFFKLKYQVNFTDVVSIFGGLSKTKNSFCKFWDTTASYYPFNQTTEYCTIHPGSLVVLVEVYGLPFILEKYKDYINESIVKGLLNILDSQNNSYNAMQNSFRVYNSTDQIKQYRPPFTPPPPLDCTDNRSYIIIAVVVPIIVICISIIVVFIILSSYKKKNKIDQINLMAQNVKNEQNDAGVNKGFKE
ncbi:uncharacterized protein LOC105848435 isoform X1 [Hydra vulgaris]|uniref:uncharacterized protein LOC105848435 isoform X1 n=1 Tax=Hydra vulgaris TaxID=6087 RepID=UPI001F5F2152|nr:uncharacterized protein LOC105848435 isoform X1 [Hydra vulgaris]